MSGAELTSSEYRCLLISTASWFDGECTNNVVFVLKVCIVLLHGCVDGLEGRDEIVENGGPPCFALATLEPASVDDAHLLEHRRLAAFASTWLRLSHGACAVVAIAIHTEQQELHLALCLFAVAAEILLNVGIFPRLGVGGRGFASKTHDCRCHVTQRVDEGEGVVQAVAKLRCTGIALRASTAVHSGGWVAVSSGQQVRAAALLGGEGCGAYGTGAGSGVTRAGKRLLGTERGP